MSIVLHQIEGNPVGQRENDGYINGTKICKISGKKIYDWKRVNATTELIQQLEVEAGIPASELIVSVKGGDINNQGTWIHPDLAVPLAMWANPKFAIQVSRWVRDWAITAKNPIVVQDISDYEAYKLNMRMESLAGIVRSFVDGCSTGRLDQLEKGLKQEISDREREVNQLRNDLQHWKDKHIDLAVKHSKLQQDYTNLLKQKEYRQKLNQIVAKFGEDNEGYRKAIWNKLYGELIARTGFEVYAAAKLWNCSCLDAVETQGLMGRLYYLASEFVVS